MEITVLLFGNLTQLAGTNKLVLADVKDSASCNELLLLKYPAFKNSKYVIALNQVLVKDNQSLNDGDEVAFLPAFSGG